MNGKELEGEARRAYFTELGKLARGHPKNRQIILSGDEKLDEKRRKHRELMRRLRAQSKASE